MSESYLDLLVKFAFTRYLWHSQKYETIKTDIEKRDYGPNKIVSDWLECWTTTVDDGYTALQRLSCQPTMVVYRVRTNFHEERVQRVPTLLFPGSRIAQTDVFMAAPDALPAGTSRLPGNSIQAQLSEDGRHLAVRLVPPPRGTLLGAASYQAVVYAQEPRGRPHAVAVVVVDVTDE